VAKRKRKLTSTEKAEKKRRREQYMTIFINGKQKRVQRPPTIEEMDSDEFIRMNADPIWLHQNEMWEYMENETEDDYEEKKHGGIKDTIRRKIVRFRSNHFI
jgi:hypothetical protein